MGEPFKKTIPPNAAVFNLGGLQGTVEIVVVANKEPMCPIDVIMTKLDARLMSASPRLPMRMNVTQGQGRIVRAGAEMANGAVFVADYALNLSDSTDAIIATIALSLAAPCTIDPDLDTDALCAYAEVRMYAFMHDYLRETLHWLTGALGLSPLVIEPFRVREPAAAFA